MADPGLKISIGSDVTGAVQGLRDINITLNITRETFDKAGKAATKAGKEIESSIKGINNLAPFIKPALNGLALIPGAAAKAGTAIKNISPGVNQAANALTNVGRVAQDLPFGFVGIQNNLNPLLESFQRLRAETGSGKAALAALGSSLIGPAGIGIALSVVSSAILIFQNGVAGFNRKTKEASDAAKDFVDKLRSVADVSAEAGASVQGQIANVQALAKVVTDANNSYTERSRALTELKQINKAYFGDLKLEENQMGVLTAAVNQYTQALVAQAVLKGFTDEISKVSVELAKQQSALDKNRLTYQRLRKELDNTKETEKSLTGEDRLTAKYGKLKPAVDAAQDAFNEQRDVVERLSTNFAELNGSIDAAVKNTLQFKDLSKDTAGEKKATDALKERIAALKELQSTTGLSIQQQEQLVTLEIQLARRDGIKLGFTSKEIEEQVQFLISQAFQTEINPTVALPITVIPLPKIDVAAATIPQGISEDYAKKLTGAINTGIKNELDIGGLLRDAAVNGLATLGNTIGEVIAGAADIGDIFGGVFQVIGQALKQFGQALIEYGIALKVVKLAIKNPTTAILAGIALIAAGSVLQKSIPQFATGITSFGGGLAVVGERGPEVVNLPAGSDVIPNSRLGGFASGNSIEVVGVIRGRDIYLANSAEANTRRRI